MSTSDNMIICKKNGHFYDKSLSACPHCPTPDSLNSTILEGGGLGSTVAEGGNVNLDRTIAEDDGLLKTEMPAGGQQSSKSNDIDLNATYIAVTENEATTDEEKENKSRATKRIVGWLVSYSLDRMGRDYRIFEGRNTIGKGMDNSILITDDPAISNNHLTLLFNNNNYYISDEMSGNGTKINNESIRPKDAIDLKDGDIIEIGNTSLLFRTSLVDFNH